MKQPGGIFNKLDLRRRELGMSTAVLARRSGVSFPTVQRILTGRHPQASWANVQAIAHALGMALDLRTVLDPEDMREEQAKLKARRLMKMVQGTSALEAQALGKKKYDQMLRRSVHELLAGPTRKLWAE